METGTHSIWISEQIRELGHEVMVANVRELRAISHSDRMKQGQPLVRIWCKYLSSSDRGLSD